MNDTYRLPDLAYDYGALEPHVSGKIMAPSTCPATCCTRSSGRTSPDGALAAWEPVAGRIVVQQVYDHQGNHDQGTVPLLAIDAWEHAYYLQYLNAKGDFFDAIWQVVNWTDVAERLTAARPPGA